MYSVALDECDLLRGRLRATVPRFAEVRDGLRRQIASLPFRPQACCVMRQRPDAVEQFLSRRAQVPPDTRFDLLLQFVDARIRDWLPVAGTPSRA